MKPIVDTFIEAMVKKDMKNGLKELVKPIGGFLYDHFYVYIWIICVYNIFFIFIVLANLFLLLKLVNQNKSSSSVYYSIAE
jgi:hypothetical protein